MRSGPIFGFKMVDCDKRGGDEGRAKVYRNFNSTRENVADNVVTEAARRASP